MQGMGKRTCVVMPYHLGSNCKEEEMVIHETPINVQDSYDKSGPLVNYVGT